jgi:quinone-modifying oxidoreductase, subunit QmoC
VVAELAFSEEIANLLYAAKGQPLKDCLQCGTCSASCPAVEYMDHTPRQLIALINADVRDDVVNSNTYWTCSSCYYCTVRCPANIDIAGLMYGLKRYSMWRRTYGEDMIGPDFSESFVKMVMRTGRSFEPILAPTYVFKRGVRGLFEEGVVGSMLMFKGRMPLLPKKIDRLENFRRMVRRIVPIGGA